MKFFCLICLAMVTRLASAADRYVYVNNQNQPNTITAFHVNANGSLTQLDGSPFVTGGVGAEGPIESMAIVRFGPASYLYAANGGDGTVSVFTIDRTTGNIQPIAGSPFATDGSSGTYDMLPAPIASSFLSVMKRRPTSMSWPL